MFPVCSSSDGAFEPSVPVLDSEGAVGSVDLIRFSSNNVVNDAISIFITTARKMTYGVLHNASKIHNLNSLPFRLHTSQSC